MKLRLVLTLTIMFILLTLTTTSQCAAITLMVEKVQAIQTVHIVKQWRNVMFLSPQFPLKPTKPEPVAFVNPLTGEVLEKPKAGEWLAVTIELSNSAAEPVGFDAILIVYDETGVPVIANIFHEVIEPGTTQIPITIGKLPAGTYTVEILLWESVASMRPLSEETLKFKLLIEQ